MSGCGVCYRCVAGWAGLLCARLRASNGAIHHRSGYWMYGARRFGGVGPPRGAGCFRVGQGRASAVVDQPAVGAADAVVSEGAVAVAEPQQLAQEELLALMA